MSENCTAEHRAVPPPGEQRGGGPHRDVSGGCFRAPGGGDHGGTVGRKVSPATISELNKKAYVHIEDWRNRPLQGGHYPYVYVDGIQKESLTNRCQTLLAFNY